MRLPPRVPDWNKPRHLLNDGKYTTPDFARIRGPLGHEHPAYFPEYIESKEHPFLFCASITYPGDHNGFDIRWSGTDSPITFEKNLQEKGPSWKYATKEIFYDVNSSGYRTYDWADIDWPNAIVLFGCSVTYGVGVATDETLAYYLEQKTGRQVVNLGYPGGSNQVIATLLSILIEKYPTPYAVVLNYTTGDRYRHYFKNRYVDMGPWHLRIDPAAHEMVDLTNISVAFEQRYMDRYNELSENYCLNKMCRAMCKNTKLVTLSYFEYMAHIMRTDFMVPTEKGARDLLHPGSESHFVTAAEIAKRLV